MIALKLQNLSKYYASQTAVTLGLSDVNLEFSIGEFVAVTGDNGSGKSTLANVIGGMLPYEGGELYVMGKPTSHYNAADWERYRRDMIGFISQDYGILPGNTVFENVESALILSGCEREAAKERTREILKQVELSDYAKRRAAKLSSGQKQRLAIARALAKPSRILIADEPTGNLDRANSDKVISLLKEAAGERLVIVITHEFSEVKDFITRHIVLSEGKVIRDTRIEPAEPVPSPAGPAEPKAAPRKASEKKRKAGYVARLTAKARPVFFIFTLLILLLTCVASFIFIGNFIIATDDVPSRYYDSKAFKNGDPLRIVVVKEEEPNFTDEDLKLLSETKYVSSVEKYGYICDVNYHYREDIDLRRYTSADYFDNYDPISNPDAFALTVKVELLEKDPLFMQSVTRIGELKKGRIAEGFYEVVSADQNYKVGDTVEVFIRDRAHWGVSVNIRLLLDVVGETSEGRGLFFSESLCRMFNNSALNAIYNGHSTYVSGGDLGMYPVAPYDAARFADVITSAIDPNATPEPENLKPAFGEDDEDEPEATAEPTEAPAEKGPYIPPELQNNECMYPESGEYYAMRLGDRIILDIGSKYSYSVSDHEDDGFERPGNYELTVAGLFKSKHMKFILVSPETYESMTGDLETDQVSVFIEDYAYIDRAIEELTAKGGYFAMSPFTQGSTTKDAAREKERINLLRISLAAAVLTLALQIILLKVTFSSLKDHYRLLSNMGLRAKTAYGSLAVLFIVLTLLAEALGAAAILLLNRYGYSRVVNIFKYLDPPKLLLIFAVHFVFCVISYFIVVRSLKKQVFSIAGVNEDVDPELMEEVLGE